MDYAFTDCDRLSKEIWCFITSWLDVWEILNLSLSQKSLKFLLTSKTVWNFQIKNYLPLNLISDKLPKVPPQKLFIHIYKKYNNMRNHLAQIILKVSPNMNAIDWLEANYKNNAKKKEELETIITENYHSLPSDYYILFRLLDGQDMLVHHFPEDVCFFGGYHFNEKFYEFEYLPLSQPEFPVLHKMKLHTFAINRETGIRYYVDFHNIFNCGVGSILTFLNQRMEHGTIIFRVFILKQSLFQLLEELQRCSFSSQKRLIDHFDTLYSPQSDVTTEGIRIRAFSIFNPWEMSASGFLFAYQIRISSNGLKGKWRLTTRHLIITDGNNQEEVEGVEVSEKTLELHEKGEDLLYESWINTQRLVSSLKGYLYFVNLETKQEVRAVIGEIIMEFPKGCSLLECKQSDLSIHMLIDRREDV